MYAVYLNIYKIHMYTECNAIFIQTESNLHLLHTKTKKFGSIGMGIEVGNLATDHTDAQLLLICSLQTVIYVMHTTGLL